MTAMAWQSCGVWNETCRPTPAQQARAARLAAQIAETAQAGFILPGTLTERMTRCGYPRCRCHADPPSCTAPTTSGPAR